MTTSTSPKVFVRAEDGLIYCEGKLANGVYVSDDVAIFWDGTEIPREGDDYYFQPNGDLWRKARGGSRAISRVELNKLLGGVRRADFEGYIAAGLQNGEITEITDNVLKSTPIWAFRRFIGKEQRRRVAEFGIAEMIEAITESEGFQAEVADIVALEFTNRVKAFKAEIGEEIGRAAKEASREFFRAFLRASRKLADLPPATVFDFETAVPPEMLPWNIDVGGERPRS